MTFVTRFAPSPTGALHLGHVYSAMVAHDAACLAGGTFRLRIEDVDSTRCRPEWDAAILADLRWLGLDWDGDVRRQSDHLGEYRAVLDDLDRMGVIYPCGCRRREILAQGGAMGRDGIVYPGTCRARSMPSAQPGDAVRLNLAIAMARVGPVDFEEDGPDYRGHHSISRQTFAALGDPVLRRIDTGDPAYHLAVSHDDALQGITHVIRGVDLWPMTPIHVLLQRLMDWPTPRYHHHSLIRDASGQRLAKVDRSRAVAAYRGDGLSAQAVRDLVTRSAM